jgi:hypothetical protein
MRLTQSCATNSWKQAAVTGAVTGHGGVSILLLDHTSYGTQLKSIDGMQHC